MGSRAGHLTPDTWLAERIGREAYRLTVDESLLAADGAGDRAELQTAQRKPVFIYAKAAPVFAAGIRFLRQAAFDLIDTNVVLEKPIGGLQTFDEGRQVRYAVPEDRGAVVEIARRSFCCSRFHLDPAVPGEVADRIKADWAGNYFDGKRGQQMVVGLVDGRPAGFLQLLHAPDSTLVIDLIAVDETCRRKGLAREMIAFAEAGAANMQWDRVGTQIANTASIRLYESLHFRFAEASYVFHFHRM